MMRMRNAGRLVAIAALALTPGCDDAGAKTTDEPEFQFRTIHDDDVAICTQDEHGAVAGARVVVSTVPASEDAPRGVLWQGLTGDDGCARGKLSLEIAIDRVAVIVTSPGRAGPYDDEAQRAAHGPFAPAAWVTVPVASLKQHRLELTHLSTEVAP